MENNFVEWLMYELNARGWNQSDLAYRAKISRASISDIFSGRRSAGPELCTGIAKAFSYAPEVVFRHAGILPPARDIDPEVMQAVNMLADLPDPIRKMFLNAIRVQHDSLTTPAPGDYNATKPAKKPGTGPLTEPKTS